MIKLKRWEKGVKIPDTNNQVVKAVERFRVQLVKDVQDHLLGMAPKALKVKHDILRDSEESIWLRDRVATYVIDKIAPNPSQQINIKGAIISAQYTDEELKQILTDRLLFASSLLGGPTGEGAPGNGDPVAEEQHGGDGERGTILGEEELSHILC